MTENSLKILPETKIAFIQARWHADIVDECRKEFVDHFSGLSNQATSIDVFDVPGAYEAPLLAKRLAKSHKYKIIGDSYRLNIQCPIGALFHMKLSAYEIKGRSFGTASFLLSRKNNTLLR